MLINVILIKKNMYAGSAPIRMLDYTDITCLKTYLPGESANWCRHTVFPLKSPPGSFLIFAVLGWVPFREGLLRGGKLLNLNFVAPETTDVHLL